jgi:hypothetical protein
MLKRLNYIDHSTWKQDILRKEHILRRYLSNRTNYDRFSVHDNIAYVKGRPTQTKACEAILLWFRLPFQSNRIDFVKFQSMIEESEI